MERRHTRFERGRSSAASDVSKRQTQAYLPGRGHHCRGLSLHQPNYAQRFADRIIGLANSHIVFDGAAGELNEAQLARIYAAPEKANTLAADACPGNANPAPHLHSVTKLEIAQ